MLIKQYVGKQAAALLFIFACLSGYGQTPAANKPLPGMVSVPYIAPPVQGLPAPYTGVVNSNYVRVREGIAPYDSVADFDGAGYQQVRQTTQYMDGLGRLVQTVSRQASAGSTPRDLVAPVIYDELGRETNKYLPYVQSGSSTTDGNFKYYPFSEQNNFYKNVYKDANGNLMYAGEQYLFSRTEYEPALLGRATKTMAPGNSWTGSGKGVNQDWLVNHLSDSVRIWTIGYNQLTYGGQDAAVNIPASPGIYALGELYKNVARDEHNNAIVEYKDKEGHVVLKKVQIDSVSTDYGGYAGWLCTYYVYDDFGSLRFVIPPKAVEAIRGSWTLAGNTDVINELCFRYEYDERKRMTAKKVPGAGWVYMVYDTRDRLVYTQDAGMRQNNQWMVSLYDSLNRVVMTGMLSYNAGRNALQGYLDSLTNGSETNLSVSGSVFDAGSVPSGKTAFTNTVSVSVNPLPAGYTFTPLTINHYDNYQQAPKTYTDAYNSQLTVSGSTGVYPETLPSGTVQQTFSVKGMMTWSKIRVLENPDDLSSGDWLSNVTFYDSKDRVIQTQANNYKGGSELAMSCYDFLGKVLGTYLVHTNPKAATSQPVKVKTTMSYDHAGRLLEVWQTVNDDEAKKTRIVKNEYDELGQTKTKQLGQKRDISTGNYTNQPVETLDYTYNIRGWLKGINAAYSHPELVSGVAPDRWFGMELNYDWGSGTGSNQLGGNISSVTWKSRGDGVRRAYGYSYDKANRLLGADYSELGSAGTYTDNADMNFDVLIGNGTDTTFDANGNILGMCQWGRKQLASGLIDKMSYSYFDNSNKLRAVTEQGAATTNNKLGDFTDGNTLGDDYGYDRNGNMVTDRNKRIGTASGLDLGSGGAIRYNHLNLPWQVAMKDATDTTLIKGTITYIYDAAGNKLEKWVHENASGAVPARDVATTYMAGGIVYQQDTLQFVAQEEGRLRIRTENNVAAYNYDYFIKDHLGNVRMVLTDEAAAAEVYQATIEEGSRRPLEAAQFGDQVSNLAVPKSAHPGFDQDTANHRIVELNGNYSAKRTGPGVVLKVMAGDKIRAATYSWYQGTVDNSSPDPALPPLASDVLGRLLSGMAGAGKGDAGGLSVSTTLSGGLAGFLSSRPGVNTSVPTAYLNWVMFDDEQFDKVAGCSGFTQVPQVGANEEKKALFAVGGNGWINITRNGYIYVYVSNESKTSVYFDDIRVEHKRGPLLEETHYYPFGLIMAGISSTAIQSPEIKNKYEEFQGQPLDDDLGLIWNNFKWRNHDPQTGRFVQVDPLSTMYPHNSTYAFSENKVTSYVEMEGLEAWPVNNDQGGTTTIHGPFANQQMAQDYYNSYYSSYRGGIQFVDKTGFIVNNRIVKHHIPKTERNGMQKIQGIIVHRTVSSSSNSTFNTFLTTRKGVHFVIDQDGTIYQIAALNKFAVHIWEGKQLKGFSFLHNYNTIGIEHVGMFNQETQEWNPVSDAMARSSAWLINSLMATYKLSPKNVFPHDSMQQKTPGEGVKVIDAIQVYFNTTTHIISNGSNGSPLTPLLRGF